MNGLFDIIAARFAPEAEPAIRPRPLARFEGRGGGEGLREEKAETVAKAPSVPLANVRAPAPRSRQPHMRQAVQQDPATRAHVDARVEKTSSLRAQSFGEENEPHKRVAHDAEPPAASQSRPTPPRWAPGYDEATPQLRRPPQVKLTETLKSTPKEPLASDPPLTERIIETRLQATAPQSTPRQAEPLTSQSAPLAKPAPAAAAELPVIHIGRIEVSRPVPPAPLPSKPALARAEPPRRVAPASRVPTPSRLTDYLGWKK